MHHSLIAVSIVASIALVLAGCSKSDDQRKFENRAFTEPSGITEMNVNGQRVQNGEYDVDDWTIGPMFGGLVEIATPAFPNPVPLNSTLRIDIEILGYNPVSGMEIYSFRFPDENPVGLNIIDQSELSPGILTININPQQIAGSTPGQGTYRILIYDGRQNLISYGDVRIE